MNTRLFINTPGDWRGSPSVWARRLSDLAAQRGFQVTHRLEDDWAAGLFIANADGLEKALEHSRPVGYRVANGYLARWFHVMQRKMRAEHHAVNAAIAHAIQISPIVIYQSQWAKNELDHNLFDRHERFEIIYNGVDLQRFSPGPGKSTPVTAGKDPPDTGDLPVIGTVGRLRYRYRLETFLEVSARLETPHQLLIIGDLDKECAQVMHHYQSNPRVGPRIMYHSYTPQNQLPSFYRQMTLLVHPVCGDACPNVVVEALACGVPVVAPRFGGAVELIGEAGVTFDCEPWVYDADFIQAMADAVHLALSDANRLSILARQRAEAQLDIERMLDNYLHALGLPPSIFSPDVSAVPGGTIRNLQPSAPHRMYPLYPAAPSAPSFLAGLRQTSARLVARPRYYSALTLRKAHQVYRRLYPPPTNSKPRIAFTLYDFHVGGIENWLYRLAKELGSQFDFYFLATKVPDFLPKFSQVGVTTFLPDPFRMTTYLQKQRIDILQVHNERWPVDAALAAGVPYIIERLGGQRGWRRVPKFGIDLIIASAQMAVEAITDLAPAEKIRIVYNGIDLEEVDHSLSMRLYPENTFVIGRTSRFGRGQNLGLLIEAIHQLRHALPQLRLVLVGGNSLMPGAEQVEPELHDLVKKLSVEEVVHFAGVTEDPLPFVHGFDVGTCVSNDEGIPNSLIEAMACRKPVISTQVGAIPELIEHDQNGLLIPPGDLDALCSAIERLALDQDLCSRLGEAARQTVEKKFSLQSAALKYAGIYNELLKS